PTVGQFLEYILGNDAEIEVVGRLINGKQAVKFVGENKPDIITMDIDMPVMDGLEATRQIMSTTPVPIIVVTASRNARQHHISMEALAAGALTVIEKPLGISHPKGMARAKKMVSVVKIYSQVRVIRRVSSPLKKPSVVIQEKEPFSKNSEKIPATSLLCNRKYVAIGVSTGGPEVLKIILSHVTDKFPFPILVVQHITVGFLESMVAWLNGLSKAKIKIAEDKEFLKQGFVYFAPDKFQMGVSSNQIELHKFNKAMKICPSVEYLFTTLAQNYGEQTIAMILTGMGSDGSKELKMLKKTGALTIAQDKDSSLVHGMPGVAIKLGGADFILNPEQIISVLQKIDSECH
ncbi:MAG: response regulator, partial [Prolixibacteraceae bacterium]|nr:response regulator [Prolixibacteraceae bacterium]